VFFLSIFLNVKFKPASAHQINDEMCVSGGDGI